MWQVTRWEHEHFLEEVQGRLDEHPEKMRQRRETVEHPFGTIKARMCAEIDERVATFLERPLEGDWPYLWIDATYLKVRQNGRIVSVAVTIAVAVNSDGRREVLGMGIGASEAEAFWLDFLRRLSRHRKLSLSPSPRPTSRRPSPNPVPAVAGP